MNNNLLRSIAAGLLLGAALFIMPFFLVRLVIFVLIVGALFRLFGGRRFRQGWEPGWGYRRDYAFTDRIRQMSDEEYSQFKQRFERERWGTYNAPKESGKPDNETPTNV